jgi:WXG100 family type VII secretion target
MDIGLDLEHLADMGLDPVRLMDAEAGAVLDVGKAVIMKLPGRPAGDPDALTAAARCWLAVSARLRDVTSGTRRQVESLEGDWQGRAKAEFVNRWTGLASAADEAADKLDELGTALGAAAAKLAEAQRAYDVAAGTAFVTNVAGFALSFVTVGTSEAAAAGEAAAALATAVGFGEAAVALIGEIIENAVLIAEQIAFRFSVEFGVNLASQAVFSAIADPGHNVRLDIPGAVGNALSDAAPPARVLPIANPLARSVVHAGIEAGFKAAGEEIDRSSVDPLKIALFTAGTEVAEKAIDKLTG